MSMVAPGSRRRASATRSSRIDSYRPRSSVVLTVRRSIVALGQNEHVRLQYACGSSSTRSTFRLKSARLAPASRLASCSSVRRSRIDRKCVQWSRAGRSRRYSVLAIASARMSGLPSRAGQRCRPEAPDQIVQPLGVGPLAWSNEELALLPEPVGSFGARSHLEQRATVVDEGIWTKTLQAVYALEEVTEVDRLGHAEQGYV